MNTACTAYSGTLWTGLLVIVDAGLSMSLVTTACTMKTIFSNEQASF